MPHRFALATALLLVAAVTAHVWAHPSGAQPPGKAREFQGYWMGIDPPPARLSFCVSSISVQRMA